jgi:hypothetical protein
MAAPKRMKRRLVARYWSNHSGIRYRLWSDGVCERSRIAGSANWWFWRRVAKVWPKCNYME